MIGALLSPRMWLLHVVALIAIVGTAWLGSWQVGAWQENREDKAASLRDASAVPLDDVLGPDDPFPGQDAGRPVQVRGEWLTQETVYVDGWVVTPVRTPSGSAVLVVRGSAPGQNAPDVTGPARVDGWLQPSGVVSIPDILQGLDEDLYGGYVIARTPVEPELTPVTPEQLPQPGTFTSLRNLLYGVEWWVFGCFAVFLWWRWCKDEIERVTSGTSAADDTESADGPEVPSSA